MKRSLFAFLVISLAMSGLCQAQNLKIGVVDMKKVFEGYYKTKEAESKLKSKAKTYDDELKSRQTEVDQLKEVLSKLIEEAKNPALTEEVKKQKEDAARKKAQEGQMLFNQLQSLTMTRRKEFGEQNLRIREDILEDIRKEIDAQSKKASFNLVFDKSGNTQNGLPSLLYSSDGYDITSDILKALNAKNK
jgi:outer membrane protein